MTANRTVAGSDGRWVFYLAVPQKVTVSFWQWTDGRGFDEASRWVSRFRCGCGWHTEGSWEQCGHDYREHQATGCEGFDDDPHLQRFDPTTPVGSGTPIYGPCRNCDAIECGDESWPRPICCEGCTHGR